MKSLARKVRKFRQLTWKDRRTFAVAAFLMPFFWLRLRYGTRPAAIDALPPEDEQRGASPAAAEALDSSDRAAEVEGLRREAYLVDRAARQVLPAGHCLTSSAYLQWWLSRRGLRTDLRIGVQSEDGKIQAHAWVEYFGHALNDSADVATDFSPLVRRSGSNVS